MIMHATCRPPLMSRPLVARTRQHVPALATRRARGPLLVAQVIATLVHLSSYDAGHGQSAPTRPWQASAAHCQQLAVNSSRMPSTCAQATKEDQAQKLLDDMKKGGLDKATAQKARMRMARCGIDGPHRWFRHSVRVAQPHTIRCRS